MQLSICKVQFKMAKLLSFDIQLVEIDSECTVELDNKELFGHPEIVP